MTNTAIKDLDTVSDAHGEVTYNGITFNVFRKHQLSSEFVYDDAGLTITHQRYTLTIGTTVFADDEAGMAELAEDLRSELSEPCKELIITGIGFGDIRINTSSDRTHDDVTGGPKPKLLSLQTIGSLRAIEIVWTCTFEVCECNKKPGMFAFLAFNYTTSFRIDHRGLTERTISGYAQFPVVRHTDAEFLGNPDKSWDKITITVPPGFRRLVNQRTVSSDFSRLDFSITDTQLEGPALPPGIVEGDAEYEIGNTGDLNFEEWSGRLSADFEVAPHLSKAVAAQAFYVMMLSKLAELNAATTAVNPANTMLLQRIVARSGLFSQKASFSASFKVTGCLNGILGTGGLWTPVPNTNYQQWATSMQGLWSNRGHAQMQAGGDVQAVVNVCNQVSSVEIGQNSSVSQQITDFSGVLQPNIPEDGGWLAYENRLIAIRSHAISIHNLLQAISPPTPTETPNGIKFDPVSAEKPEIQYSGGPVDRIIMVGKAMRVKHKPTVPKLTTVDGVPVKLIREKIDGPKVMTCFLGISVYSVRWISEYQVEGYLQDIPAQKRQTGCCEEEE